MIIINNDFSFDSVKEDLAILQEKYKEFGYDLTKEQLYLIWTLYSKDLSSNWLNIEENISNSISFVEEYIKTTGFYNEDCPYSGTCIYGLYFHKEIECKEKCNNCINFSNFNPT